jgi:hypothetical protein
MFKLILKSFRFEKTSKSLVKFILVWHQFKFSLNLFKSFDLKPKFLKRIFATHPGIRPDGLSSPTQFSFEFFSAGPVLSGILAHQPF